MPESKKSCECSPSEGIEKESAIILRINWKRLISRGETCPRCGSTEEELRRAVSTLKLDPLQSNRIWINDRLLEEWIDGNVGQSPCCDVCGPHDCRTVQVGGQIYEIIPAEFIIKAGLLAASELVSPRTDESCCRD